MERESFRNIKWFVLAYFALLIVILTVIGIFGQMGYAFIDMGLACALFGLLFCSALVALTVWLVRRCEGKAGKIAVGSIGVLVTFASAIILSMVCTMMLNFGVPAHYTTLVSEDGSAAVILREFSSDEILRRQRIGDQATLPEAEGVDFSTMGYSYLAYPRVMRFFYDTECPAEGRLEIGCASEALLKYEWQAENVLHLYIEDAQPGDDGELVLNFK